MISATDFSASLSESHGHLTSHLFFYHLFRQSSNFETARNPAFDSPESFPVSRPALSCLPLGNNLRFHRVSRTGNQVTESMVLTIDRQVMLAEARGSGTAAAQIQRFVRVLARCE